MAKAKDILVKMDGLQESIDRIIEAIQTIKKLWEELEEDEKAPQELTPTLQEGDE